MKTAICLTITAVLILTGCTMVGVKPPSAPVTVCQDFPGDSLIEIYIPDLRAANVLLKLSVYEASRLNSVDKKDILKFLGKVEELADASSTYAAFASYVLSEIEILKKNLGAEVVIAGDYLLSFRNAQTPISPKDICYIKYQIHDTRTKVLPWIN